MGLIKKPNELTVKPTLSALIYGQPGMGNYIGTERTSCVAA